MKHQASYAKRFVWIGSWFVLAGCSPEQAQTPGCPPDNAIRGACAGIPQDAECDGHASIEHVPCSAVTRVASDAALQTAAAQAPSGTCIALAPGTYGAVDLPGGVSLLGNGAGCVTVGPVTLNAGSDAVLRGWTTSSIHVKGASGARIESVHILGSPDTGVLVDAQSSVQVITSTIEGSAGYGLYASDSLEVNLDRVVIAGSGGPGLWVQSSSTCPTLPAQPIVTARSSIVRDSHFAGVALFGAHATLQGVDILRTLPGQMFPMFGKGGGGLSIAQCSTVTAAGLRVHDGKSFGALVDQSAATFGGPGPGGDIEIHRNVIGLVVQNVTSFRLENAQLDQNEGVGIGLTGGSQGIVITRSSVSHTMSKHLPTTGASSADVGYGLLWVDQSSANLTDLSLSGNALASVVIDGEASGALHHVTLSGGDESLGIVQQRYTGGAQPAITGGTPALTVTAEQVYPVPFL